MILRTANTNRRSSRTGWRIAIELRHSWSIAASMSSMASSSRMTLSASESSLSSRARTALLNASPAFSPISRTIARIFALSPV